MKVEAGLYSVTYSGGVTYGCDSYGENLSYTGAFNEVPICNESHIFSDDQAMLDFYSSELVVFIIYGVFLLFIKLFTND